MFRIQNSYENTIIIQKSEFICRIYRVNDLNEVEQILNKIKKQHYDATHNCYAYILGDNQDIQKCSDDGEPAKTAGSPMLDVLKKNNMTNILAIVTRYFGGILLGAGGLVRAYSSSVSECLALAKKFTTKMRTRFQFSTSYSGYNNILKVIEYIEIETVAFTKDVIIVANCDIDKYDNIINDFYKFKIVADCLNKIGDFPIEIPINTSF